MLHIFYRTSDDGYSKVKPNYVTQENCLRNFLTNFCVQGPLDPSSVNFWVLADNISEKTRTRLNVIKREYTFWKPEPFTLVDVSFKSNGKSLRHTFELARNLPNDNDVVYFVENDYIHTPTSQQCLFEGVSLANFVTLYDHPDKYILAQKGGNPLIQEVPGEQSFVFRTQNTHWKTTNSTPMTFGCSVKDIKENWDVFDRHNESDHPNSFSMFLELTKTRSLLSTIPAKCTHGETLWLAKGVDWEDVMNKSLI